MNYNSLVLYYQNNKGADPDFRDKKMTLKEALILFKKTNKKYTYSCIKDLYGNVLIDINFNENEINRFTREISKVEKTIFDIKAEEINCIVLLEHQDYVLCFNKRKKEFIIYKWFFHDSAFGNGFYSTSLSETNQRWWVIINNLNKD